MMALASAMEIDRLSGVYLMGSGHLMGSGLKCWLGIKKPPIAAPSCILKVLAVWVDRGRFGGSETSTTTKNGVD